MRLDCSGAERLFWSTAAGRQQRAQSTDAQQLRQQLHQQQQQQQQQRSRPPLQRRRSEGSDSLVGRPLSRGGQHPQHPQLLKHRQRRISFDGSASSLENLQAAGDRVVRCRNGKCTNWALVQEARRTFKSCHNCTCLYCSRECRRAHWQRHRRTCLYSRASGLCVQVLSAVKRDAASLRQVSRVAVRGFAAQGRGAVRCFFANPEAAERYVAGGFPELGEPTYVRAADILPSDMGAELHAEAIRLCEAYNPETRLVLYVSVCVVREVPGSGVGPVRWERQPVSRCAKLRLEASCRPREPTGPASGNNTSSSTSAIGSPRRPPITREMDSPETLVLTTSPQEGGGPAPRALRELALDNVRRLLEERGVSLARHFPQVHAKLRAYADGTTDKFAPVTIYPRDHASGRSFMCIIMLDAEPERLQLLPTDSSRLKTLDIGRELRDPDETAW